MYIFFINPDTTVLCVCIGPKSTSVVLDITVFSGVIKVREDVQVTVDVHFELDLFN